MKYSDSQLSLLFLFRSTPERSWIRICPDCGKRQLIGIIPKIDWWEYMWDNPNTCKLFYDSGGSPRGIKSPVYSKTLCKRCNAKKIISDINLSDIEVDKHRAALIECKKYGTCDVLAAHHEFLKDDPERLKTDFMIGLICKNNKGEIQS